VYKRSFWEAFNGTISSLIQEKKLEQFQTMLRDKGDNTMRQCCKEEAPY
jgi:hypothetical protein